MHKISFGWLFAILSAQTIIAGDHKKTWDLAQPSLISSAQKATETTYKAWQGRLCADGDVACQSQQQAYQDAFYHQSNLEHNFKYGEYELVETLAIRFMSNKQTRHDVQAQLAKLPAESKIREFCSSDKNKNEWNCQKLAQVFFCSTQPDQTEVCKAWFNALYRDREWHAQYYAKQLSEEMKLSDDAKAREIDAAVNVVK